MNKHVRVFELNGHSYTFINEFGSTRHGFKHHTELFEDARFVAEYTAYYLNRTWESYEYQTSMIGACKAHISSLEDRINTSIKDVLEVKRWCPRCEVCKQEMLEDNVDDNVVELNDYIALLSML